MTPPPQAPPRRASFASRLGPGLITGAADDDPSGIATYSQAGAQFRFGLVWTLFLTTPLVIGIQMLSARIGWVTGEGLATNIDRLCPRWLTLSLIGLLVVANTVNIAADIAAMADALSLLVHGPEPLYAPAFGALCIARQVGFSYERSVRILKGLALPPTRPASCSAGRPASRTAFARRAASLSSSSRQRASAPC